MAIKGEGFLHRVIIYIHTDHGATVNGGCDQKRNTDFITKFCFMFILLVSQI